MVESICGQGFAYAHEVEEDRQRSSQTRARKYYKSQRRHRLKQFSVFGQKLTAAGLPAFLCVQRKTCVRSLYFIAFSRKASQHRLCTPPPRSRVLDVSRRKRAAHAPARSLPGAEPCSWWWSGLLAQVPGHRPMCQRPNLAGQERASQELAWPPRSNRERARVVP
jgi:hypothetical protein